jgi:hypothetical protein
MSRRAAAWLAWSLCGVSLVLLGLTLVVVLLGWFSTPPPGGFIPWEGQAIFAVGLIGTPILGILVVSRLPGNPYGWMWLGFGLSFALSRRGRLTPTGGRLREGDLRGALQEGERRRGFEERRGCGKIFH